MVARKIAFTLAIICMAVSLQAQPAPRIYSVNEGFYSITPRSSVSITDDSLSSIQEYAGSYFSSKGLGDIVVSIGSSNDGHPEGYRVDITPKGVYIEAYDYAGAFYGFQQLLRLMPPQIYKGRKSLRYPVQLPCCHIEDWPEYHYRGVMLDVARVWVPLNSLYRLVDNIAFQNMNVLHLHLSDDEAWRVEIKSHPSLTSEGGFRGPGCRIPAVFGKYDEVFGGYYTQKELRDLVAYASDRNVVIVPEIDLPGHSRAIGAVMPDILCDWQPDTSKTAGFDYRGVWCVSKEENYKLIDDILTEICDIFPSKYIHIGGDEVGMHNWLNCPDCTELMKRKGYSDAHALEDYFMRRVTKIVTDKGRIPIAWWDEDVIKDNLPENSVVYGWQNMASCVRAMGKGHKTVLAPAHYCYLDMHQAEQEHANTWGGVVDFDKILSLSSEILQLEDTERNKILGVCGAFWGETCSSRSPETNRYQDFMLFPRLLSIARVSWNPSLPSIPVNKTYEQLKCMNIAFRLPQPKISYKEGVLTASTEEADIFYVYKGNRRRYTHPIHTSHPELYSFIGILGSGYSESIRCWREKLTPPVKITSSMEEDASKPFKNAEEYSGVSYTGRCPKVGDWIQFDFEHPVICSEMVFKTGYIEFPSAVIASGDLYISADGNSFDKVGRLYDGIIHFCPSSPVKSVRLVSDRHGNGHYMVVIQPPEIYL